MRTIMDKPACVGPTVFDKPFPGAYQLLIDDKRYTSKQIAKKVSELSERLNKEANEQA